MAFEYPSTKTARKEKKQKELDDKVKKIGKKFDKKILRQQINYSLPFGFSGVLGTIGNYFDKIIITTLYFDLK